MAFIRYNANPDHSRVRDCTVRTISLATGTDWDTAYIALSLHGFFLKDMPDADVVWWSFLKEHGFDYHSISSDCPMCVSVSEFCADHPSGLYVLATKEHVLCAIDGDWYDTWDSGDEIVLHYWTKQEE